MKVRLVALENDYILLAIDGTHLTLTEAEVKGFIFNYKEYIPHVHRQSKIEKYEGETLAYINNEDNLVIASLEFLRKFFADSIPYISVAEFAAKYGKKTGIVSRLCVQKRIPGAIKKGRDWHIPAYAAYPDDARFGRRISFPENDA